MSNEKNSINIASIEAKKEIVNLTNTVSKDKEKNDLKKANLKKKIILRDAKILSDADLLKVDLNTLNLDKIRDIIKSNKKDATNVKNSKIVGLYRNKENQKSRTKIRKIRNRFISNILSYFSSQNEISLKSEIKSFLEFYKKTYSLNDLSLNSCADNNSDKDTLIKIKLAFEIIKKKKLS